MGWNTGLSGILSFFLKNLVVFWSLQRKLLRNKNIICILYRILISENTLMTQHYAECSQNGHNIKSTMKPFLQTLIKKFICHREKKSLKFQCFGKLISLMCLNPLRRKPLSVVFLFLLLVIRYADYRPLAHKWPQESKYTSWLNNLSTAWSDRNSDSILHFSISDVGHIPQSAEPKRKKVPVAFALS